MAKVGPLRVPPRDQVADAVRLDGQVAGGALVQEPAGGFAFGRGPAASGVAAGVGVSPDGGLVRPQLFETQDSGFFDSQSLATASALSLPLSMRLTRSVRPSVVSLAWIAFRVDATSGLLWSVRISGTMLFGRWMCCGSSSTTRLLSLITDCVVKNWVTWIWLPSRALRLSGPPGSSDLNSLNSTPYTSFMPATPALRVLNSGPPPATRSLPTALRSAIDFRLYLSAVAFVTTIASSSAAGDLSSTSRPFGSTPGIAL